MIDKIEIPLNKTKLFLGIVGSLLFVILGVWLFMNASDLHRNSVRFISNPQVIKVVGVIAVLFSLAIGTFGFKKLFDKKVGLLIDKNGITDNSNASSLGFIPWCDITGVRTEKVMSTKFLIIEVQKPNEYIEKEKSVIKRRLLASNMKMYGTPVSITSNTLTYDFDTLESAIQTAFKNCNMLPKA